MILRLAVSTLIIVSISPAVQASTPNAHNSLDCLFCHTDTPRFGIDTIDTVEFYRFAGDDPALCYACHKPEENLHPVRVKPGKEALSTRVPQRLPLGASDGVAGQVVCTTCHFMHAANSDYALLRGFPGSQQPNVFYQWQGFCRHCHGDFLERRSPHAGDDRACAFCHAVRPSEGEKVEIMPRGVALCNFCHGAMQADHLRGVNPFEGPVNCLTCHNPHLGPDHPGRLKPGYFDFLRGAVTISPHGKQLLCSLCHVDDKTFSLVVRDRTALCNRCHGSPRVVGEIHPLSEVPNGMKIPEDWPLGKGRLTCLTCHVPGHQGDPARLLRGGPYAVRNDFCDHCHDYGDFRGQNPHPLIRELTGCDTCHAEIPVFGRDTAKTVKFKASINLLCLRCHDDTPHPGGEPHTLALSAAEASDIPEYLPLDRYDRVNCATCHNPHLPGDESHKLRETIEGAGICIGCHTL